MVAAHRAHLRARLLQPDRRWMRWIFALLIVVLLLLSVSLAFLGEPSLLIATVAGFATSRCSSSARTVGSCR